MRNPTARCAGLIALALTGLIPGGSGADGQSGAPGSVVSADGSGQFRSIQEAINAAPQTSSAAAPWTIRVMPGTYHEIVYVQREKHHVRIVGADPLLTKVTFGLFASMPGLDGKPIGTFHTPTFWIDADDFAVENLTIENSAGPVGQALALRLDGDRASFRNCRFLGWQDTILANRGRDYFYGCTIRGAVDFIFGGATALFEHCTIDCIGNGYITAASTPESQPYGFVFTDCDISGAPGVQSYLGRPWRPHAKVVFFNCRMSAVIRPAGWHNWNQPEREKTSQFAEFGNTGPGADLSARVAWSKRLSSAEASEITADRVLGGPDGWTPSKSHD
jgi:pectinesterase